MDLREQIICAAIGVFSEKGLKFTMQDTSAAMHISKKTIYTEFPSKEELLLGMLDYGYGRIRESKQAVLQSDLPMKEKLRKVMIAMPEDYLLLDFRKLSGLKDKYPEVNKRLISNLENGWEPVIRLLEEGIARGVFRPVNPAILKATFSAAVGSFLGGEELKAEGIGYADALEQLMDILMEGISY